MEQGKNKWVMPNITFSILMGLKDKDIESARKRKSFKSNFKQKIKN